MTVGQFCSLCWISNKKFDYKIVTKNHNTNLYHHLHHKNVIKQTNTLHFIPKNSGKNGIAHHYTIIHKCNTKIVSHSYDTNLDSYNKMQTQIRSHSHRTCTHSIPHPQTQYKIILTQYNKPTQHHQTTTHKPTIIYIIIYIIYHIIHHI